jgi:hypothetical protein
MAKIDLQTYKKLYPTLPEEIKKLLDDPSFGQNIFEFCKKEGIGDMAEEILDILLPVLVGLSSFENFKKELEAILPKEKAKIVFQFIFRTVFYQHLPTLERFYQKEEGAPEKEESKVKDKYREPIE